VPILPVHLPEQNDDGSFKDGLDFSDYTRCQTQTNSAFFKGRAGCPSWASNLRQLGELLARYMECRAGIMCPRIDSPERRVMFAQTRIIADRPVFVARLDRLSAEYVELKNAGSDPERLRALETQIRALDGKLTIDERGPALIVGIIHYYYRCGYDSPETCIALNHAVSPVGVRQIANRLEKLWQRMQDGTDKMPKPAELRNAKTRASWRVSEYRRTQAEKDKTRRAEETPEQRAARLKYAKDYYYSHRDRIAAQQRADWRKRDKALERYRSLTPEQIEERRRKARIYEAKRREELNRAQRERQRRKAAAMSEEEKVIKRAQSRAYAAAHREHLRAYRVEWRAKKKAQSN